MLDDGRNERIRTSDPYNPIVVRYQAAPRSEIICVFYHKEWGFKAVKLVIF